MINKFEIFISKLFLILNKEEMRILPGNLAFFFVFALVPIVTIFVFFGSLFNFNQVELLNFFNSYFPKGISDIIVPAFTNETIKFTTVILLVLSLLTASNGAESIIVTSNKLYKIKDSNLIQRRVKSIFLIILIIILLIFMFIVPVFGDFIMHGVKNIVNDNVFNTLNIIYLLLKFPFALFFVYMILKIIYTIAPDKQLRSKEVTKGSIFTTIFWVISSFGYSYYISNFANYSKVYGNLSSLIILMFYVYLLAFIFVVGMAFNALRVELDEEIEKTGKISFINLKKE